MNFLAYFYLRNVFVFGVEELSFAVYLVSVVVLDRGQSAIEFPLRNPLYFFLNRRLDKGARVFVKRRNE
jgi:hypothetical protein